MDTDLHNSKFVLEVLKLHSRERVRSNIEYLLVCRHILELHCSSLHHIPYIVILDLNVLQLVMEDQVSNNFTELWLSQKIQVKSNSRSNK